MWALCTLRMEKLNMRLVAQWLFSLSLICCAVGSVTAADRPNILFCIADDWGWPHAGAYGDQVVQTPAFDRIAREGVRFENAFVTAPSCTPCRNSILTGQYHWRLEHGGNLWTSLHPKFPVYPLLLEDTGYRVGFCRKAWGPGNWKFLGRTRNPAGPKFASFKEFLSQQDADQPFCFWLGASDPHRPYAPRSGVESGIDADAIKVPADLPNHPTVREDVADYYFEVQRFDSDVAAAIELLEARGELENTIIVMTGDHGMPFPRHKTHLYDSGTRVCLAVRWGEKVLAGRNVTDFVSLSDLAPTFLQAAGVEIPTEMTGQSLLDLLLDNRAGRVDPARDHVLTGRERHTPAQQSPSLDGYPMRALRTDNYLYIRNYAPERWPTGVPGSYRDCDDGPTKTYLMEYRDDPYVKPFYDLAFAKRPPEELYDLATDPDQLNNVAGETEYQPVKKQLAEQLTQELIDSEDPREVGGGQAFDRYTYRPELRGEQKYIQTSTQRKQPNVILIMTDDQGYGDLSIHGNKMLQTPKLDELARESVQLTDFHVDPTCAETRAALMTGRYSCRTGVWHTINGRSLLREDEVTMADVFEANGYATGIFGKWHLGDNYPLLPRYRGFQTSLIHGGGGVGQTPDFWGNDYFDDTYFRNGKPEKQQGFCTDVFFGAALEFIEQHRDEPFFCYIPTNAAHGPYRCPKKYSKPYLDQGVREPMASFYGMIANIDENVGHLNKQLADWGLVENTVLVFMSDNGTARGVHRGDSEGVEWLGYNGGLRGTKTSHYEGGHRVPFIVRWPAGGVQGGVELSTLTAHIDLLPTFVDLCGLDLPRPIEFDGDSLKNLWQTQEADEDLKDRTLVVHSQRIDVPEKWRKCEVMKNQWRLVSGKELYDLAADRGQTNNVISDYPEVVAELKASYEAWWSSVSSRFDEAVRIPLGADEATEVELTAHDWHATEGEVPWNHGKIKPDPKSNGYWLVDVKQAGRYEIVLRNRPVGVRYAYEAGTARVVVGAEEQAVMIDEGADSISLEMTLPAGPTQIQTWISEQKRGERGAYFVYVNRL